MAGREKNSERRRTRKKSFELLKILARGQPRAAHVVKMCNTRETHLIIRVPAVIKTWADAERRESLAVCQGQSTIIIFDFDLKPDHTALYGLITAKTRQKVISRDADNVVCVDVEFNTRYGRFIDVAGRREKSKRRRTRKEVLNCSKF